MATLVQKQPRGYDVLAEALTSDGRTVRRVEARADDLRDVAEAFRLAAQEARKAHLPVARVVLSASRGGVTEITAVDQPHPVIVEDDAVDHSGLLDGRTKVDAPPLGQAIAEIEADQGLLVPAATPRSSWFSEMGRLLQSMLPWQVTLSYEPEDQIVYLVVRSPVGPLTWHLYPETMIHRDPKIAADELRREIGSKVASRLRP